MDVVWMAKSIGARLLATQKGQSMVEYILLLAVLSSLGYAFYNNKRFKDFMKGTDGMFATMKKGMSYSYRYGRNYNSTEVNFDEAESFDYGSNKHDLYFNSKDGKSHFFSGDDPYP